MSYPNSILRQHYSVVANFLSKETVARSLKSETALRASPYSITLPNLPREQVPVPQFGQLVIAIKAASGHALARKSLL